MWHKKKREKLCLTGAASWVEHRNWHFCGLKKIKYWQCYRRQLKNEVFVKRINLIFWKRDYLLDYKELKQVGEACTLSWRKKNKNPELLGILMNMRFISQRGQGVSTSPSMAVRKLYVPKGQ